VDWDIVVIGAGVVGLACAERLARAGLSTLLVERHARFGQETSSRNSQVIHAGMYYPRGSLKATLCVRGNASIYAWCESRGVAHRRVGKYIVATDPAGEVELDAILERGRANGVTALVKVPQSHVAAAEPNVIAHAALWSPDTGIIDTHELMSSFAVAARGHGCDFAYEHHLMAAERTGSGYELRFRDASGESSTIRCARVVNSAGLEADLVAALPGLDVDAAGYRLHYAKGSYFRLQHPNLVSRLIYPVPFRNLTGLGVHVTLELDGGIRLGPDVEYVDRSAVDYAVDDDKRDAFFDAAASYLRGIRRESLMPDQAGIRPKLQAPGEPIRDFVIAEESARGLPGWVNLIGIESPGLTCSLEIADRVAELVP
jgi:L-2-hydroxyglutarate oxidase LhgO